MSRVLARALVLVSTACGGNHGPGPSPVPGEPVLPALPDDAGPILGSAGPAPATEPSATEPSAAEPEPASIRVELTPKSGASLQGHAELREQDGALSIELSVTGAPAGLHGVHVHEVGDCSAEDASSAGAHFDPDGEPHGLPEHERHHLGDLGNMRVDEDGSGRLELRVPGANLEPGGPRSFRGRALVVHAGADDGVTQPSGDSGARIACGVIAE